MPSSDKNSHELTTKDLQKTHALIESILSKLDSSHKVKIDLKSIAKNQSIFGSSLNQIDKKFQKSSSRLNASIEKLSQDKDKADIKKPFLEQMKEGLQEIGNILLEMISFIRDLLKSDLIKGLSSDSKFKSILSTIDNSLSKVDEMVSSFMPSIKPSL